MRADPLDRFHQLVDEARGEMARASSNQPGRTPSDLAEAVGAMRVAEGKVLGYLEALALVRPDLARLAVDVAEKLTADVQAIRLTIPSGSPGEPFPDED